MAGRTHTRRVAADRGGPMRRDPVVLLTVVALVVIAAIAIVTVMITR